MSRISDALISGAYNLNNERPVLNLTHGGQQGWAPNLTEWVSNQAYVSRPLICIVLEVPKFMTILPNSTQWISSFKSLFETHARTIDGLNETLTVDTDEHPIGGAGEMQEEITDVKRERSVPRFTFIEKYGRPIQSLHDFWIRYGGMDPNTKFSLLGTLGNGQVTDWLADWYTASMLFFEPDPIHKKINKAWVVSNMFPKGTGDITSKRDLTTGQEILTLDIEYTAISQVGYGVKQFAQQILDNINITNADPYMMPSFITNVSSDVDAASTTGYKAWTQNVAQSAVSKLGA